MKVNVKRQPEYNQFKDEMLSTQTKILRRMLFVLNVFILADH